MSPTRELLLNTGTGEMAISDAAEASIHRGIFNDEPCGVRTITQP
jgi:hypothetical protein